MKTPHRRQPTPRGRSLIGPASGLVVLAAATSLLAGSWGVPLGSRAVKADIATADDVDHYLVEAHAGALLDVRVKPAKGSTLVPDLAVLGPDGAALELDVRPAGAGLRLRRLPLPSSGRYEVRVAARDGTSGAYAVSAKVKGSAAVRRKGVRLAGGQEQAFEFAAGGGATMSFAVRARPSAATFVRVETPAGRSVPVPEGAVRGNAAGRLRGKRIPLPADGGFGPWRLVLRADAGTLDPVSVKISTRGGRLDAVRGRLAPQEPVLLSVDPAESGAGGDLRIAGLGLVTTTKKRALRLFVGGIEAGGVALESDTVLRGTMPEGLDGPVDVAVLNGDGHAAVLRDALLAVPPPRATSFEPKRGPAAGETVVIVRGTGFREGSAVTIAGTAFPSRTELIDDTQLRFTTPAFASGPQTLGVQDPTGQESVAPGTFDFVAAPFVLSVRPPYVPLLDGESIVLRGGAFTDEQEVRLGGALPSSIQLTSPNELRLGVPELPVGVHDLLVADALGQSAFVEGGLSVFGFARGPEVDDTGGPPPSDLALCDFDDDGDLDVFLVSSGGASLASESLVRVLRNDDGEGYTDVTDDVMPTPEGDDWRGDVIAFGDVAGDIGAPPPDGWPDLVIGSLDTSVLASGRSRVRVLANRAGPGGSRVFVDRTSVVMAPASQYDAWRAEDLWIGDLDGDGGVSDIVATHDEIPEGVSPLTPYYVYYLSGTRVFSFATPDDGGYGAFAWQSRRMPTVIGTQVPVPGFPTCVGGTCRDTYTPFRGRSLAVSDLDGDGRMDIAVTSPDTRTLNGASAPSTQIARNQNVQGLDVMVDRSALLNGQAARLLGDIVLSGNVIGDGLPDLVIVRAPGGSGLAVDIVENRGFEATWTVRTQELLPAADDDERLQADAAELVDVDGDGDLDLVLLVVAPPVSSVRATGLGLRVLRNHGEQGFSRELEDLLPRVQDDRWSGSVLGVGTLLDDVLGIVIGRGDAGATGAEVRTILRTTEE